MANNRGGTMADERRTIVDALMEIGQAKITPVERRRRITRLLYDIRADRIERTGRPGRTWLHHPEHGDLLLKDEDWKRSRPAGDVGVEAVA
ncbi:MAG: hypothetical protein SFW09_13400 [Hyphomicrobiaceae bacterium]|nr:hypothetical protein [Hyphomicrobiaceae bacterium]